MVLDPFDVRVLAGKRELFDIYMNATFYSKPMNDDQKYMVLAALLDQVPKGGLTEVINSSIRLPTSKDSAKPEEIKALEEHLFHLFAFFDPMKAYMEMHYDW